MSLSLEEENSEKKVADIVNDDEVIGSIYYINEDNVDENQEALKRIRLNDENEDFIPIITTFEDHKQVDRVYVCGETGTGKTSFICLYANIFHKKYPKAKIFLISSKTKDDLIDKYKFINRIDIDESIVSEPITLDDLGGRSKQTLVIFDDIEDFKNKKMTKQVEMLRDEVMRNGRSRGIYSIFVHHNPCDYVKTRSMIFEANKIVIFPKQSGENAYDYLLRKKVNLSEKIINTVTSLKSKWVLINKANPKFILSNKYILLV